jgi:hypothetical protein
MIEKNPRITLDDDARGIDAAPGSSAFLDWLWETSLIGDDGNRYWFGGSPLILKLENVDLCTWGLVTETCEVRQDPNSIYKIADFCGENRARKEVFPGGTHKVTRTENEVTVEIGCIKVICHSDQSWNIIVEDEEKSFSANITHRPDCHGPLWYGREKPSYLTQHSITYGYNCSGRVEGTLTIDGRVVQVRGAGIRERYVAIDSSAAEIGGWEDWGWFHFDEAFGSMYDMRLGQKDQVITLVDDDLYLPAGKMDIQHHEWAYMPQFGGFIPTVYKIQIETENGTLKIAAHAANARTWGVTGKCPDNPVATIQWDVVEGTFTYCDGTVKELHNGYGNMSIRQWRAYPSMFPPIGIDSGINKEERFTTL